MKKALADYAVGTEGKPEDMPVREKDELFNWLKQKSPKDCEGDSLLFAWSMRNSSFRTRSFDRAVAVLCYFVFMRDVDRASALASKFRGR